MSDPFPRSLAVIDAADPVLRRLYADVLADLGYEPSGAAAPGDRLAAVVLDRDGFDVPALLAEVAGWRRRLATAGLPLVLCVSNPWLNGEAGALLRELGVAVLPKPFDLDALARALTGRAVPGTARALRRIGSPCRR